jgi:sulfur carrier protein ThiS
MKIHITLMGALREHAPSGGTLTLDNAATVRDVLHRLDIDEQRVQVVSVNHHFEHNRDRLLQDGDRLIVMPVVVGG